MKKLISMLLSALICTCCLVGCADKAKDESSSEATANLTEEQLAEWDDIKEYKTDSVTYRIPKTWEEIETEENSGADIYRRFEDSDISFSVQFEENGAICEKPTIDDVSSYVSYCFPENVGTKDYSSIQINDIECFYFKMWIEDENDITLKLVCQSEKGLIFFNFFDNNDVDFLESEMVQFTHNIKNNIDYMSAPVSTEEEYTKKVTFENLTFYVPKEAIEDKSESSTCYYTKWGFIYLYYNENVECIDYDVINADDEKSILESSVKGMSNDFAIDQSDWVDLDGHRALVCSGKPIGKKGYGSFIIFRTDLAILIASNLSAENFEANYNEFIKHISIGEITNNQNKRTETSTTTTTTTQAPSNYTIGEENAIESAMSYIDLMSFSKAGLYKQLTSEYGEGYTEQEANKAISYLEKNGLVNWKEEAVEAAQDYLRISSYSRDGLYRQLTSEYGEQFTAEEAEYALSKVGY